MSILMILFVAIVVVGALVNGLGKSWKQFPTDRTQPNQRPPRFEEGPDLRTDPWKEGLYEQQSRTEETYKSQPRAFREGSARGQQAASPAPHRTISRTTPVGRPTASGNERRQQSAYDFAFGAPLPPLANEQKANQTTNGSNDATDDDLQILQPTVHVDLTEIHESVQEHMSSVHETIQIHRRRTDQAYSQPAPKSRRSTNPLAVAQLSKSDVARALVLGEVLGEPRAKRPWRPKTRR